MDTYFIYGLLDSGFPSDIRYVGQTVSMVSRLRDHMSGDVYGSPGFWKWGVRFFGRSLQMIIIDAVRGSRDDARRLEASHILRLHNAGCRLVNTKCYKSMLSKNGIPSGVLRTYVQMLRALHRGVPYCDDGFRDALFYTGTAIDSLESTFPQMALWGPDDCFRTRILEIFKKGACRVS